MKKVWKAWTPLTATVSREKACFSVSGRDYEFEKSAFPTSVRIGGSEFLSRPIELTARYDGREEKRLIDCDYHELENGDEKAVFQLASRMGNTVIDGRVSCEFDGFMEICLSVIPFWSFSPDGQSKPQLDKLYIDIPVRKEFARLYHYWPNAATSIIPAPDVVNADAIPAQGVVLPFKPYVWIGDEFKGLGLCMESDEKIECDGVQVEYLTGDAAETVLRIHLLDHMPAAWQGRRDEWVRALNPIDYRIGLMATPVKQAAPELKRDWRVFHTFDDMFLNECDGALERLSQAGVKWVIFHEGISRVQNYGMPDDEARFRRLVDDCHKNGLRLMIYFGYEYSTLAPDWYEKANDYLIHTTEDNFTGGWQRKPHQRAFMVCYNGGYSSRMIERVKFVMDEYGVDGIYTDGTYVPWECANTRHGCGYTDRDGKRHTTFPIFAVRDHVKRLYEAVHERGGLIDTHQSSCCIAPTLSFCDTYYDGENIQGALISHLNDGITNFLNLDAFRTEYMGKNLGLIDQFIFYARPEVGWTIEKLAALTMIHDVIPRPRKRGGDMSIDGLMEDLNFIEKVWKVYDAFDVDSAEWLPYWLPNDVAASETKDAFLSVYRSGDKRLGVLSNLTPEKRDVTVATAGHSVRNALTGEIYPVKDGRATIPAEGYIPYLLEL